MAAFKTGVLAAFAILLQPAGGAGAAIRCGADERAPALAANADWRAAPIRLAIIDQSVAASLAEAGRLAGMTVLVSAKTTGRERGRTLAGPFGMVLDAMVKANGLTWFTDGGAVHVATGAETATKTITPTAARMDVCGALRGAGLDGEGQRVVTGDRTATRVTGSPDFISTVEAILKSTPSSEASGMTLVKFGQVIHE